MKSILTILLLSLIISGCSTTVSGLQSYIDSSGYQFLYPNGWVRVEVENATAGVDVVFRDIIERSENLSVIISEVGENQSLTNLGTASDVGYRFMQQVNNDSNFKRRAELINAETHTNGIDNYYILEYQVKLNSGQERHNIASVVVSEKKLFTFNISTTESRWQKQKDLFNIIVNSFEIPHPNPSPVRRGQGEGS